MVASALINGNVIFRVNDQDIDCSIVEKMVSSLKPREKQREWSAYPDHHRSGLTSSGFLRVQINTLGVREQWVETDRRTTESKLLEIIGAILAAGPELAARDRRWEEHRRQRREDEYRRSEARRLRELDSSLWQGFRGQAAIWNEHKQLVAFLADLERRLVSEGDVMIGDRPLSSWLEWARQHMAASDPLRNGAAGLFADVALAASVR